MSVYIQYIYLYIYKYIYKYIYYIYRHIYLVYIRTYIPFVYIPSIYTEYIRIHVVVKSWDELARVQ
jgi:hypothetical protein